MAITTHNDEEKEEIYRQISMVVEMTNEKTTV